MDTMPEIILMIIPRRLKNAIKLQGFHNDYST